MFDMLTRVNFYGPLRINFFDMLTGLTYFMMCYLLGSKGFGKQLIVLKRKSDFGNDLGEQYSFFVKLLFLNPEDILKLFIGLSDCGH